MNSSTPSQLGQFKNLDELRTFAQNAKAWPFAEARKILKRLEKSKLKKNEIIFETGYGPSGLPHIGTFGEVARTSMVRHAFSCLSDIPTRLICFSDDMDGLRKVPDNIPNQEMMAKHINKPLTSIPDPFEKFPSFGEHNNAMLKSFLDHYGFEYEFYSATDNYKSGRFDEMLLRVLQQYDKIMNIMLPTIGEERRKTYSPFLPISKLTGDALQNGIKSLDSENGTITYEEPTTGELATTKVTGGNVKLQWKVDWAMRWAALGVDYEMCGKDLTDSVTLSGKITRILGNTPPASFIYELFLDENGQKISKSKGNGLTIDEWLRYGTTESLSLFMYQTPTRAKRLYFDVIPKNIDDYLAHNNNFFKNEDKAKTFENPSWHIHNGNPHMRDIPLNYSMILNLVSASNSENKDILWGFIKNYNENLSKDTHSDLDELVEKAINYYKDFVKPHKQYRMASSSEIKALKELLTELEKIKDDKEVSKDAQIIQNLIFQIGKNNGYENLREWFQALYEILLGQSQGPRMGSFLVIYGIDKSVKLINDSLERKL